MNIIFGDDITEELRSKYILLELDTFQVENRTVTSYCLVEHVSLSDIPNIGEFADLHHNLMKNYKNRNWKFCEDAIEHLMGKWNRELDSFYLDIAERIGDFRQREPGPDWQAAIIKT